MRRSSLLNRFARFFGSKNKDKANELWQDREIRFDLASSQLKPRNGESIFASLVETSTFLFEAKILSRKTSKTRKVVVSKSEVCTPQIYEPFGRRRNEVDATSQSDIDASSISNSKLLRHASEVSFTELNKNCILS